jgi:hypothetical protein
MPCVGLMAGALLIKAFATWLKLNEAPDEEGEVVTTDPLVQVSVILFLPSMKKKMYV